MGLRRPVSGGHEHEARRELRLPGVGRHDRSHGVDKVGRQLGSRPERLLGVGIAVDEHELHPRGADRLGRLVEQFELISEADVVARDELTVQIGDRADARLGVLEAILTVRQQQNGVIDRHLSENSLLDHRVGGEEVGRTAEERPAVLREAGDVALHHGRLRPIRERGRAIDSTHGWPP